MSKKVLPTKQDGKCCKLVGSDRINNERIHKPYYPDITNSKLTQLIMFNSVFKGLIGFSLDPQKFSCI